MGGRSSGRRACLALLALAGCAASPPDSLRGVDGASLAPCPSAPRCVSSQAEDPGKRVPPLHHAGTRQASRRAIVSVVEAMEASRVVTAEGDYVHATYTSDWLGFVDDVEFVINRGTRIDVHSSARIGYYDFGVNRARVEAIRRRLQSSRE